MSNKDIITLNIPTASPYLLSEGLGYPTKVRIVPHNTDDTKLVLKTQRPDAVTSLGLGSGFFEGSKYCIFEVDKAETLAKIPSALATITDSEFKLAAPEPEQVVTTSTLDDEPELDDDEFDDDEDY